MKTIKIIVAIVCFLLISTNVFSTCTESFSWLPNTEPNVSHYKIYYGETDGVYPNDVDVGKPEPIDGRCNGDVEELDCDKQYYFVCVAVNFYGKESLYSDQVIVTTDDGAPSPPRDFKVVAKESM